MIGRKTKVLISKIGLDFHEAGAKLVASWLKGAGFEVIYLGLFQTAEAIANTAIQEDVDLIGISSACGAHLELIGDLVKELKRREVDNIPLIVGGVIPPQDIPILKELGVKEVFASGSSMAGIVSGINEIIQIKNPG
jgi:methylmalonyl-CoA mutase C-terminal domain/subunit